MDVITGVAGGSLVPTEGGAGGRQGSISFEHPKNIKNAAIIIEDIPIPNSEKCIFRFFLITFIFAS